MITAQYLPIFGFGVWTHRDTTFKKVVVNIYFVCWMVVITL